MADSAHYRSLKKQHSNYLPKLRKVANKLPVIIDHLKLAENYFLEGGYISEGNTLDNGELKKCYVLLEDNLALINRVITNTEYKIKDLQEQIEYMENE